MATRILPGAYVNLYDRSQFPEGRTSLTVGFALKAKRGEVGVVNRVTSPADFLTKYTFSGMPSVSDDPTFWSVLKVLTKTNQVYIVRAAKNASLGGLVLKKSRTIGTLTTANAEVGSIVIATETTPAKGTTFIVNGTGKIDGTYTVKEATEVEAGACTITVEETIEENYTPAEGTIIKLVTPALLPINSIKGEEGEVPLTNPEQYEFTADDLFLITAKDEGAYSGKILVEIVSSVDNPTKLIYDNTVQVNIKDADTKATLESFIFSRDVMAKEVDGTSLYIDSVTEGSAYVNFRNNEDAPATELPASISAKEGVKLATGSDGEDVTPSDLAGAFDKFNDKTIPVSILGNGCSPEAENIEVQKKLLEIADNRKDIVVFLNSRAIDEKATLNSDKADNIVEYKKGELADTSYYAAMYAPHVKVTDSFNSRQVKIGADAVAIAGWLDVINTLNYPFAYAGPRNGLVTGVTCDWKIGDESGEAESLNDASVNYIAYDGKVGRYYMQCQNTLQIANSSLRNLGCVLNILDIKEHIAVSLKEYSNLPITSALRRDILNAMNDYLNPMIGTRAYNLKFQDVTTDADIAQDTLRYLLTISLTRYAATIYCDISVVNSTFDFSMIQSA